MMPRSIRTIPEARRSLQWLGTPRVSAAAADATFVDRPGYLTSSQPRVRSASPRTGMASSIRRRHSVMTHLLGHPASPRAQPCQEEESVSENSGITSRLRQEAYRAAVRYIRGLSLPGRTAPRTSERGPVPRAPQARARQGAKRRAPRGASACFRPPAFRAAGRVLRLLPARLSQPRAVRREAPAT